MTERCCGCGRETPNYEFVAVLKIDDTFVHRPICQPCFLEPARRPGLKAHFFNRTHGERAARVAGSTTVEA